MDEGTKERLTLTLEQARSDSNGILIDEYRRSRGLPNYAFYSISNAFPSNEGPGKRGGWVNLEDFHLFLLEKASGSIGIGVHVPAVAPRYDSTGSFDNLLGENEVVQPVAPVQASVPASRPRKKPQCSDSPSPTTSDNEFTPPPMKRPKTVQHQSLHKPGPLSSAGGHGALQPAEKPRIMSSNIPSSTTPSNQAVFKVGDSLFRPGKRVPPGQECGNCRKAGRTCYMLQRVDGRPLANRTCSGCRRSHKSCSRTKQSEGTSDLSAWSGEL